MKDNDQPVATPAVPKSTRTRSPNYPAMSLRTAVEKAKSIWDAQQKHPAHIDTVLGTLGYSKRTGPAVRAISALDQYGLTTDTGSGDSRAVRLSDLAINYLHADSESERQELARTAALKPAIFQQLWEKYGAFLPPSDELIKSYLIREKSFNSSAVATLVADYRDTFDFANLGSNSSPDDKTATNDPPPKSPLLAAKGLPPTPKANERGMPPMTQGIRYLPIPLDIGDAPIPVGMSDSDFDLLLDTLKLWKKKIVRPAYQAPNPAKEMMFPCEAIWKNKDHDVPVTLVDLAGERDGVVYYQSSTGTGIPANELSFDVEETK